MDLIGTPAPANPEPAIIGGKARSPQWPHVRDLHLKTYNKCEVCGATEHLNVHHILPYHLFPKLELVESNFITLCETPAHNCHFIFGHCGDWTAYNPDVVKLVAFMNNCWKNRKYTNDTQENSQSKQ